jgi:uncharacterized membrane protein SpoIIM required for sporulation
VTILTVPDDTKIGFKEMRIDCSYLMLLVWRGFFLFGGFILSFMVFSGLLCGSSFFVE